MTTESTSLEDFLDIPEVSTIPTMSTRWEYPLLDKNFQLGWSSEIISKMNVRILKKFSTRSPHAFSVQN